MCVCWFGAPPCVILSQTTALTFLHTVCVLINCLILPCIAAAAAACPRFLSRTTLSRNIDRCVAALNFSSFASEGRTEAANICNGEFCVCVWGFERITRLLQLPVQERPAHIQASPHSGSVNLPRNPINYLLEVPASWPAITSCRFLWVFSLPVRFVEGTAADCNIPPQRSPLAFHAGTSATNENRFWASALFCRVWTGQRTCGFSAAA